MFIYLKDDEYSNFLQGHKWGAFSDTMNMEFLFLLNTRCKNRQQYLLFRFDIVN